jgi:hypothetical protein
VRKPLIISLHPRSAPDQVVGSSRGIDAEANRKEQSPALGVLADRTAAMPIGIAYPVGLVDHRKGPAKTFG